MTTYTLKCDKDHEPMSWTTEANSEDEAAMAFMKMPELEAHVKEKHPEMLSQDHDTMMAGIKSMMTHA